MGRLGWWCAGLTMVLHGAAAAPIGPDWGAAGEPSFPPGSTMWMVGNVRACPVVYRREVEVPAGTTGVVGLLRSAGFGYVWVDGALVAEFADRPARDGKPAVPVSWPVEVDLTRALTPGRHVLAVSGAPSGIDLSLALLGAGAGTVTTDTTWRCAKFPPLTNLGREPWQKPGADLAAWLPVKLGAEPPLPLDAAKATRLSTTFGDQRHAADAEEARWRLAMLADRGWAVRDWQVRGFGGPGRLDASLLAAARGLAPDLPAAEALTGFAWLLDDQLQWRQLAQLDPSASVGLAEAERAVERCRLAMGKHDWPNLSVAAGQGLAALDGQRARLRAASGLPVNRLNEAYANRAGWLDVPELMGNRLADWGLRVNPPAVTWKFSLAGKWRFRLDPANQGLADTVQTPGYNIDNQWDQITVPGAWEQHGYQGNNPRHPADNPFIKSDRADGPYNGYAWYRKTVEVPAEWAGHDLELALGVVDDFDWTYFNGELVGQTGRDQTQWWLHERVYRLPKEKVRFGQPNLIAVRVYDEADKGGIVAGDPELRCPGLRAAYEQRPGQAWRPAEVYESPLTPVALVTCGEAELRLSGWLERSLKGPERLFGSGASGTGFGYDPRRQTANWLCLWPCAADRASRELPILLVFEKRPAEVRRVGGEVVLTFDAPGRRVLLCRPLRDASALGEAPTAADLAALSFWSRAALAYPTDYTELARRAGQALDITDLYTYRELRDEWGTVPLRVALLPPLGSFAVKVGWPGYVPEAAVKDLGLSLGVYGTLRGVAGADRIGYRVPIDPLPRLAGLTDFCFGPTDIGGPGNLAEVGLMKAIGCNSWRPQSNDLGDKMRRTVGLANQHGLDLMVNVDNRFAASDEVFGAYRSLAQWAAAQKLPRDALAYDLINEPANMTPAVYNPRIAQLVKIIREADREHPIYVETPHSYASIDQFVNLAPVADERVVYSFHDYAFRLTPRWPYAERDRRSLLRQWLPAFRYSLEHNAPIHLGEFGGFHQTPHDPWHNRSTLSLMDDMFGIFDQFGWHFHYYSNRGEWVTRADGSLDGNLVHAAFERYFARRTLNVF